MENNDRVFAELISQINEALNTDKVLKSVATTILAEQQERIFEKGLDGNNSKIGSYSTKLISISKKNQQRNTGKTHFKGGYKEYKSAIGQDSSKVNLFNTGQLKSDYSIIEMGPNTIGIGFKNEFNNSKAEGNEDRYKTEIFTSTPNEDDLFDKVFEYELNRIFK